MTNAPACPGAGRSPDDVAVPTARPASANRPSLLAALALLTIAAPALAQKPVPNPFSDRLARLGDIPRRAVLRRAILDNTLWCDRVVADRRQGNWRNLSMWSARCGRGAEYGIFIGTDQGVQVRPCADLAKAKLPACQLPPRKG